MTKRYKDFVGDQKLIGKTIAKVIDGGKCSILIAFTDGTFTQIAIQWGYYSGDEEMIFDPDIYEEDIKRLRK